MSSTILSGMRRRRVEATKEKPAELPMKFINTGCDLLNLALSDRVEGGYLRGSMVNTIGDSSSGKTMLALSACAEICQVEELNKWRIIFDDVEAANNFNIEQLFGSRLVSRLEPPKGTIQEPGCSDTIQDFRNNILRIAKPRNPFIYILDSFDALTSTEEIEKVNKHMKAADREPDEEGDGEKKKKISGSYGMEKAKMGGQILRMAVRDIKGSEGFLNIISQTRDNIDPMSFQKKTRSGGKALKFYATHEMWMACGEKIKMRERVIGLDCIVRVTKNKVTGKVREVHFPIYYSYGVDNTGANIDFLLEEETWPMRKMTIEAGHFGNRTRQNLINHIESEGLLNELRREVQKTWTRIEESLRLQRQPKYQ